MEPSDVPERVGRATPLSPTLDLGGRLDICQDVQVASLVIILGQTKPQGAAERAWAWFRSDSANTTTECSAHLFCATTSVAPASGGIQEKG
jgi:hypothetical protein